MKSRHVSRVISVPPELVYEFASDPDNLPRWAAGLATSDVVRQGDALLVDSPMGTVTVRFAPRNEYGVIDHDVALPSGTTVTNPVLVLAHPEGGPPFRVSGRHGFGVGGRLGKGLVHLPARTDPGGHVEIGVGSYEQIAATFAAE